jgi:hypothetical protein
MIRSSRIAIVALALGVSATNGCDRRAVENVPPLALASDLEPLRDHFNAHRRLPRALFVLSPT